MRDCDNCARCGRDGCKSWDCDFVPRKEAIEAWKEKHETADRPQGEWISQNLYWHTAICSNCNKVTMFEEWNEEVIEYDFCPNCGCRMKGADDEIYSR